MLHLLLCIKLFFSCLLLEERTDCDDTTKARFQTYNSVYLTTLTSTNV